MGAIEQYFLDDYKRLKAENERLAGLVKANESKIIQVSGEPVTAVKVTSSGYSSMFASSWGFMRELEADQLKVFLSLDDESLIAFKNRNQSPIVVERREFPTTMAIRRDAGDVRYLVDPYGDYGSKPLIVEDNEDWMTDESLAEDTIKNACKEVRESIKERIEELLTKSAQ